MWKLVLCLLIAAPAWAQSVEAQRASIAKQRAAIARQRGGEIRQVSYAPILAAPVFKPRCAALAAPELARMIDAAADANRVPSDLVREVARQESAFHPCAVSGKGAEGLMQLMPATQSALSVDDPFDPEESLMAGARLLRELLTRYNGSLPKALSAYNAGPSRVDRAGGIPAIAETRAYVAGILSRLGD